MTEIILVIAIGVALISGILIGRYVESRKLDDHDPYDTPHGGA